jgi:hypothetical protein
VPLAPRALIRQVKWFATDSLPILSFIPANVSARHRALAHTTLPDHEDIPPKPAKFILVFFVPGNVTSKFFPPVDPVAPRDPEVFTSRVLMPETPLHKDHSLVLGKNDVWFAREISFVNSESVTSGMEKGVPSLQMCSCCGYAHHTASAFGDGVHHLEWILLA